MGALIRTTDWTETPLGPRHRWPSVLRTAVDIVVASQFPMALLWGRELILLYNDAYRVIAADRHPRALGRSTREIWPEVWHINVPIFAAVLERGETVYLEDKLFPIDRRGRREDAYFTLCYSPVRAEDGTVAGSLVTLLETTRRVREEEALRAERNRVAATAARERELLAGVIEHVPVMITVYAPHLETFHLNAETRRVLGWTDEDANMGDLLALCYPDPGYREEVRRFMESAEPGWRELVVTAKDGSKVTSSWANVRLSDSTQVGIGIDLRERKRAEAELRQALGEAEAGRRLLDALLESIPIGITIADAPDVRIRAVSRYGRELTGRAPETIEGIPVNRHVESWGVLRADGMPARNEDLPLTRATQQGEHVREEEWLLVRSDGTRVPILCTAGPIRGSAGEVLGGVIGWQDITERKKAESALQEREERLRLIIDATGIGAFDFFPQTGRLEWSAHAKRHFGLPPEARVDYEVFLRGLHPEDRERVDAITKSVLRPESGGEYITEYRTIGIEDGVERRLSARGRVTFDDAGKPVRFVGITQDITQQKKVEEALRESEERLRLALEAGELGTWDLDLITGKAVRSLRHDEIFGYREAQPEWSLEHALRHILPEDRQKVQDAHAPALGTQRMYVEARLRKADGGIRWMMSTGSFQYDEQGRAMRLTGICADITERKRAEEALRASEERTRRAYDLIKGITEATNDLVAALDTDFRFIAFNTAYQKAFEQVFGPRIDVGASIIDALAHLPDDQRRAVDLWRRAMEGETVSEIEEFGDPKRARRFFDLRFGPIRDASGRIIGAGEFASDVTERVQGEQALREAKRQLEEADRHKNEFLAALSHELRNPLAPIRNSVYILEHALPGGEQASRARQVIDRQAQHMTRLIEDLLDVTRISRGKITLQRERLDLNALARGTAEDHREIFSRNGIDLEIDVDGEPLCVDGDRTRLAQVIGNLLSNSAKFTPRGGRTILSVDAAPDGKAVLRVRDNGAGMSEETLQHLFEPFVQAAQTLERSRGGLGLGLALVKGLVEMHGGEVTASSEGVGKGSEFTVILPLQAPARPRLSVVPAPKRTAHARRVLVIEDNVDAAESLREALELGDHEVAIAYSGPEGVEAARRYKPDVVLCDIGLPELDGYGVAQALRADPDPKLRSSFMVALSGYALPEDVQRSREVGFDRHLAKPPSMEALETLLQEASPRGGLHARPGDDAS